MFVCDFHYNFCVQIIAGKPNVELHFICEFLSIPVRHNIFERSLRCVCVLQKCKEIETDKAKTFYLCFFRSSQFFFAHLLYQFYFLFATFLTLQLLLPSSVSQMLDVSRSYRLLFWPLLLLLGHIVQLVWKCADTRFTSSWLKFFTRTTVAPTPTHTQNHCENSCVIAIAVSVVDSFLQKSSYVCGKIITSRPEYTGYFIPTKKKRKKNTIKMA